MANGLGFSSNDQGSGGFLEFLARGSPTFAANQRNQIEMKRLRMQQAVKQFEFADKIVRSALTLPEKTRDAYLDRVLPLVENAFPGSSKTVREFSKDKEGFNRLTNSLENDPKTQAIVKTFIESGDGPGALEFLAKRNLTQQRLKARKTDPQVGSPTKGELSLAERFFDDRRPEGVPDFDDSGEKDRFIDILANKAKKSSKKNRTDFDTGLNNVFDDTFNENVDKGEVKERFGFDFLKSDTATTLKKPQDSGENVRKEIISREINFTKDNPAKPTTQKAFDALKSEDYYINPEDNELYRKK